MFKKIIYWPIVVIIICLIPFFMYYYGFRINITASMPKGLYLLTRADHFHDSDLVAIRLSDDKQKIGLKRGYIKMKSTLLFKRLIASPRDSVVYNNNEITVNNTYKYKCLIFQKDSEGHKMNPIKAGVYKVSKNEYWVLGENDGSWDSRYFGPVKRENIINKVTKILVF